MRATGIIPVRMASGRFPGKPLAMIAGKPMVQWVWEALAGSRLVFPHYVATADLEIVQYCEANGIDYLVTASTCGSGSERVFDAMRQLASRDDEVVLNVQGDEPTIRSSSLDDLARAFNDDRVQVASLYYRPAGKDYMADPNKVKVILTDKGDAFSFSRKPIRWFNNHGVHVGVYAYRRRILGILATLPWPDLEQIAWMRAGWSIRMIEIDYETASIDRPKDVERAAAILS